MKALISIALLAGLFFASKQFLRKWDDVKAKSGDPSEKVEAAPNAMPGLAPQYETSLEAARAQGPDALKQWLKTYQTVVFDPRKADIELDYVVLIARHDPAEARRAFQTVKARTPSSSPVYPRIQKLSATYD